MTPSPSIEGIWGPGNNLELWALKSEFQPNFSAFSVTSEIILAVGITSLFTHIWLYFKSCFLSSNEVCETNAINFFILSLLKKEKKKIFCQEWRLFLLYD